MLDNDTDKLTHGLLDLGSLVEEITIRGRKIAVYGVSTSGMLLLIQRVPEIKAMLEGRLADLTPERLMAQGPTVVAKIIAMGTVRRSDFDKDKAWEEALVKATKIVVDLPMGDQAKLLIAVLKVTMPDGRDPFVAQLNEIRTLFSVDNADTEQATTSPDASEDAFTRGGRSQPYGMLRRVS